MPKEPLRKKYPVFPCANIGKYGPEKTPYLDTFHARTIAHKLFRMLSEDIRMASVASL